jgi:hypothetical protein
MLIPVISSPPLCIMLHPPVGFASIMAVYIIFIAILSVNTDDYILFLQKSIINNDVLRVKMVGLKARRRIRGMT